MRYITIILLSFLLLGCEDKVSQPVTKVITQPAVTPEPNPETEPSQFKFAGIDSVEDITKTSATVKWKHVEGFYQYNLILITKVDRKIIQTVSAPVQEIKLTGLTPDTEYTYLVRAIDTSGFLDANIITKTFKTDPWPNFTNQISLHFNSSQSVSFGASNQLGINNKFTISLWFKTDAQRTNTRLITLHKKNTGGFADIALSIGLENEKVQLTYTNKYDILDTKSVDFEYYNSQWHHLAVTTNGNLVSLFLDGQEAIKFYDTIAKFGSHAATLGAYTGTQQGYLGLIDEVGMFSQFFTQKELIELYNFGQSMDLRVHSANSSLKHWYQLGDQSTDNEDFITDVIGSKNGSTLNIENTDFTTDSP